MSETSLLERMRLEILGDKADNSMDNEFKSKLDDAEIVALDALYPFDGKKQKLPVTRRLKNWQVRCAIELYKAMEHVGVQSYSENSLLVSYLTSLVSSSLMGELIPKAGVPK